MNSKPAIISDASSRRLTFDAVAATIANGKSPQGLSLVLERFSPRIGKDPNASGDWWPRTKANAVNELMYCLSGSDHLRKTQDVRVTLDALPSIKKDLRVEKKTGRPPNIGRTFCAAVMLEVVEFIRVSVKPHSLEFRKLCGYYWNACGGKDIGKENDPENWRKPIEAAQLPKMTDYREFVRKVLPAVVQNPH
jgi:hypothetical protein